MWAFYLSLFTTLILFSSVSYSQPIDTLIHYAVKRHPIILAIESQLESDHAEKFVMGAYPEPMIGIEWFNTPISSFPNPFKDQKEMEYSISQMIMFPGKISAMQQVQSAMIQMSNQQKKNVEVTFISAIYSSWVRLCYLQETEKILSEIIQWNQLASDFSIPLYENGKITLSDRLMLEMDIEMVKNERRMILSEIETEKGQLSQLTLIEKNKLPSVFIPISLPLRSEFPETLWIQYAIHKHPMIGMNKSEIERRKFQAVTAKNAYLPDMEIKFVYKDMLGTPMDHWSLMVGINLPIAPWSEGKVSGQIQSAKSLEMKANYQLQTTQLEITQSIQNMTEMAKSSSEILRSIDKVLLPQSAIAIEAALSGYQTGMMSTKDWFSAIQLFKKIQLMQIENKKTYELSLVDISRLTSIPINELFTLP